VSEDQQTTSSLLAESAHSSERLRPLPFGRALEIAWNSMMVRLGRSLLVTSGIVLALAFLSYILFTDSLGRSVFANGSDELVDALQREGIVEALDDEDARIETWWMVGIALLVSFVGILNAMVLSVTERYREIGTMKCLGALDYLVVELFLLESAFQGVLGTLIGIFTGLGLVLIEGSASYGSEAWSLIPGGEFGKIGGVCFMVGLALTVSGALYPAWRAAKMEPVEALRSEA
jgi:hypothetical protein